MNDHSIEACKTREDISQAFGRRREWLCDNHPSCPKCREAHQIQLMDWIFADKAQWKCRKCKHYFEYEPDNRKDIT